MYIRNISMVLGLLVAIFQPLSCCRKGNDYAQRRIDEADIFSEIVLLTNGVAILLTILMVVVAAATSVAAMR